MKGKCMFILSPVCVQGEDQKDQNGGRTLDQQQPAANESLMLSKHNLGYLRSKLLLCDMEHLECLSQHLPPGQGGAPGVD